MDKRAAKIRALYSAASLIRVELAGPAFVEDWEHKGYSEHDQSKLWKALDQLADELSRRAEKMEAK